MMRELDYCHQEVQKDTGGLDVKSKYQKKCFLVKYADAKKRRREGKCSICYSDQSWLWKYWSKNTGVAPEAKLVMNKGSRKGQRMIISHALDQEGELRDYNLPLPKIGTASSKPSVAGCALWTWKHEKDKGNDDYHDAMDHDKFQKWVTNFLFLPTSTTIQIGQLEIPAC